MCPAENSLISQRFSGGPQSFDRRGDPIRLSVLIGGDGERHRREGTIRLGPALRVPDRRNCLLFHFPSYGAEQLHDRCLRAIVDFQLQAVAARVIPLKGGDIRRGSAPEAINTLPVVAYGPQPLGFAARQQADEPGAGAVDILVLVC